MRYAILKLLAILGVPALSEALHRYMAARNIKELRNSDGTQVIVRMSAVEYNVYQSWRHRSPEDTSFGLN